MKRNRVRKMEMNTNKVTDTDIDGEKKDEIKDDEKYRNEE